MYGSQSEKVKPGAALFETRFLRISIFLTLSSVPAGAQSDALLEAIRVHRPEAAALAKAELDACHPPQCTARERLSLITGFLELSEGNAPLASRRLAGKAPKGLEAFHGWYFGEAQAWAGRKSLAVQTLIRAKKMAPAWLNRRIDRRLAELYVSLGDPAKARVILDADPDVARTPELLLTRALARRASKLFALARADLKALAVKFPSHPHGESAKAQLEADGTWKPTFEEHLERAQGLLASGAARECLSALGAPDAPGARTDEAKARLALLSGQALLSLGPERAEEAKAQLRIAAQGPAPVASQALITLAKRLMRLQDHQGARAAFRGVDEKFPNSSAADEAGYLAAWLTMTSGELDAAVAEFIAFETKHFDSRRRDEARWFRGYSLFRAKRYAEARDVLLTLPGDFPKSSLVPQALYWATRAGQLMDRADAGTPVDVVAGYQMVANGFPGTFYALLATERLEELSVMPPTPFAVAPKSLSVKRPAGLELATLLARTGLFQDAGQEVSRVLAGVSASDALTWGHALQSIGDFGAAHTLAARHLWGAVYTQRAPEAVALMYPRAYQTSVEPWAKQHGIEPWLAWAIMRRESGFSPQVTSFADARGLMQIIPPTAKGIALELKIQPADDAELYSPDWNIRLGTWYLHALAERFGHPTLVAAAYNGGPSTVARWATERSDLPLDQWVEEIPYKETRGYVKQVTTDVFIYRQLYSGERRRLPMTVPVPTKGIDF